MVINKNEKNTYNTCIFRSISECEKCILKEQLDCHFNLKKLIRFITPFFFIVIVSSLALIINGLFLEFFIYLIILVSFSIIFFEFWEIRILCSHCPFYAEDKKTLHCYGNYKSLKVWKYHPEPMSKSEKIQLIIGFFILFFLLLLPSIILIFNQQYLWIIPVTIGFIIFLIVIKKYHCAKCFNFSCPLNKKPKEVVDEFLRRNPVMRKAWEDKGWNVADIVKS